MFLAKVVGREGKIVFLRYGNRLRRVHSSRVALEGYEFNKNSYNAEENHDQDKVENHSSENYSTKSYVCEKCDKCFENEEEVNIHGKTDHGSEKPQTCQKCGENFENKQELSGHIKETHNGTKYECETCNQLFSKQTYLDDHINTFHNNNEDLQEEAPRRKTGIRVPKAKRKIAFKHIGNVV